MKVVVDASNVAYHVKNENGQPKLANILAAVKALEESEDEFVIIADASLRHDIDDKEKFSQILKNFGGISIEFPTVEEFKSAITLALVYYYKEVMHYSWGKIETLIDYERDIGLRYGSKIKKLNKSIKKQLDKVSNSVDKPKEIFEI